jgi:putative acetyltransferase
MTATIIRPENPEDAAAITHAIEEAFRFHPPSNQTEHRIVLALREAGALAISLVAELDGKVVGHIAFSRVQISDGSPNWYGLAPVSVIPELQRKGIGSALIKEGLTLLRELGAAGCVVLGDPDTYQRFGFRSRPDCIYEGVPQQYFQSLSFGMHHAVGQVTYHRAFAAP